MEERRKKKKSKPVVALLHLTTLNTLCIPNDMDNNVAISCVHS